MAAGVGDEGRKYQKSYFDVLGLCCTSEVPLIEKILGSLDGVVTISVVVPSKTVIVVHDTSLISQLQIVKALNQARLEATIRSYGGATTFKSWPSPYTLACGALLALSFLGPVYKPMHWLALVAVAVGIPPILLRSIASIRQFTVDINILVLIAVAGSIGLKDYLEAGIIVFLFTIADWLNSRATYKATAVMSTIMNMIPQKAVLAESGAVIDARDVKVNTVLSVKAGEVIPIDGIVVEGSCEADESSLTGESFPVAKQADSLVWAGTHNLNGYINFKTTALAENSAVAKMTKMVEEAQNSKSRINRIVDSCAKYYTPLIICASAALVAIPAALKVHNLAYWFQLALVLLVSACPCALVLSTPVATFCALTKAATTGLLIKGGDFLEILAKTKVVAFDKTGTLTRGEFCVMDFHSIKDDISIDVLLYWVASIESKSSHPMSTALVDHAHSSSIEPKPDNVSEFQNFPGEGVYGEIDGKKIHIGSRRIAQRAGCVAVRNVEGEMKGVTIGHVFVASEPVGWFSLLDACRTGVTDAIKDLKGLNAKIVMLTGDSQAAASHIQLQVGGAFDFVHSELLPEDKVRIINELKSEGTTVMVGDGINDAPSLTAADVGISMGISGSAVAMETSHITMMSNDVRKIPWVIKLAKRTKWKIFENIILSISTKAAILALAFSGHPILWAAVLADVGTCLLVILNSMTLLRRSKHKVKKCCRSSHETHRHGLLMSHGAESHEHGCCGTKDDCHGSSNATLHDGKKHHEQNHCGVKHQHQKSHTAPGNCCTKEVDRICHRELCEPNIEKSCTSISDCHSDKRCCNDLPLPHKCSEQKSSNQGHTIHITSVTEQHAHDHSSGFEHCRAGGCATVATCSQPHKTVLDGLHNREAMGCCRSCRDDCMEERCCREEVLHLSEIVTE